MAEPPFSGLEGSLGGAHRRGAPKTLRSEEGFETRGTRCVFGVQDHRECFRSSGVSGRKMCCGAPETSQSGASAGKLHADTPKGSEMNVKMTEVGHMGRKHSLMPRRMI